MEQVTEVPVHAATGEAVGITLARMEGKVDRVFDRVEDLRPRVDRHDVEIGELKSATQTLKEGAVARDEKALALALGLKDAKEATEATARGEAQKENARIVQRDQLWSPVTRVFAVVAAVAIAFNLYQSLNPNL